MRFLKSRWIHAGGLLALVVLLALAGCAGEDGKDGVDGEQGPTGPEGPEGPPGTATCMNCHTDSWDMETYLLPYETEYAVSQHANAETFVRRSAPCSRCHTGEGFQAYIETGTEEDVSQSSPIGCFTCHAPHTNETFDLRKTGATTMDRGGTYDKSESNTCAVCHQARVPSPDFDSVDEITSRYWGPHHGPQSSILSGQGAYQFGGEAYAADATHNTSIPEGCVNCHMAEVADNGVAGGHSWWMHYEYHGSERINSKGCGCHGWDDSEALDEVDAHKDEFETRLADLGALLLEAGFLEDDLAHVTTGEVAPATADDRGAVFNYLMLLEDRSGGVHNPTYTDAVLEGTISYMETRVLP